VSKSKAVGVRLASRLLLLIAVFCIAFSAASANEDPMNFERKVTPPVGVGSDAERLENRREGLERMRRLREKMSQQEINEAKRRAEKWLREFHR
jgi:hypothetical protein